MIDYIKTIEELSLNAWPSHQMQIYDGWILRFSYFYTHRTNCVEQIGPSSLPFREKIRYCEEVYRHWKTPCVFKITPLLPAAFDPMLEECGYTVEHVTEVKSMDLNHFVQKHTQAHVQISTEISPQWLDALFTLKKTTNPVHRLIVPTMYAAIPKKTLVASITIDGEIQAIGLGILDRDHIGLYAINVNTRFRQQHLGRAICQEILKAGIQQGAKKAYLQVVPDNISAKSLYQSLGFQDTYTHWFRSKNL
ncbi:MAG: GNAT family N-acetyltransferase [Blautia sp.]